MRNAQQITHLHAVEGSHRREALEAHLERALARLRQRPERSLVVLAIRPESDDHSDLVRMERRVEEVLRAGDWARQWANNLLIVAEVGSTHEAAALHHRISLALDASPLGESFCGPTLDILAPNPWRPAVEILEWAQRSADTTNDYAAGILEAPGDNPVSVTVHADDAAPRRLREYMRSTLAGSLRERLVADICLAVTEMATQLLVDEKPDTLHLYLWRSAHRARTEVQARRVVAPEVALVAKPGSEWGMDIVRMLATQTGETLTRNSRTLWCDF